MRGRQAGSWLYWRLMHEARPYWRHIGGLFALSLLSSVFALLTPLPLKIAVDSVVGSHPLPGGLAFIVPPGVRESQMGVLLVAGGLFVLISLLRQLQEFGKLVLTTSAGERLLLQVRSRLLRHAECLSLAYHDTRGTVDSAYRIQYDAAAIPDVAVGGLIPFFTAAMTVVGMIYVTARIDWQLALVSLAVAPVLLVAMRAYRKRLRARWHDAKGRESSALSVVQQSLEALRVVKAFGREDHVRDRFADRSAASVRAKIDLSFVEGRFGIVVGVTIGLGMGTVLFLGARHVLAGTITLGELVLVMGYLQQLYDPLKTASKKAGSLQASLASAERVYALLDEAPDFVDAPDARPLARAAGDVEFRNVSFAYRSDHRVLHDVSFDAPPGTRLGIAGTTGAGKTTVVSLLTRFYDPSSGQILLDGVDLREYRLTDLRNQFAIVLQEPVLFSMSIAENIAYARPGASDAEVVAAARAAGAHDFIRALPDGYDTPVGDRGVRLSGGERQRISLARAFLKDAPILILDEPTSSVDVRTEAEILEAMDRLMSGRTTFMIAHRSSTLAVCDRRLDLEHGRVAGPAPPAGIGRSRPRRRRAAGVEDEELRRTVEHVVARLRGSESRPTAIRRRPFPGVTSYAADVVSVEVGTGSTIEIFLKDFARSRLPKDAPADRRERERHVYEDLLDGDELGTARLYGTNWNVAAMRFWLMLEFVDAEPLAYCGFAHWVAAAAWLGGMHGRFVHRRGRLEACAHLLRHDADFFRHAAERALQAVSVLSCTLARRLTAVLDGYDGTIAVLAREPETLVHGSYRPQNVLVGRSSSPQRICPTDWELAGFGRSTYDLAFLCDGFREAQLDALLDAYEREAEHHGMAPRDRNGLRHEVACFRLHKTINSLGNLHRWKQPAETAAKVVAAAEEIAGTLERHSDPSPPSRASAR